MTTTWRILKAARKCDPNLIKLCWYWKAEDPGSGQKKIDPVSCVRIQVTSFVFYLLVSLGYCLVASVLLRLKVFLDVFLVLGFILGVASYVINRFLIKNNRWTFNNAAQFIVAVVLAEKAYGKPFTRWDELNGFAVVREAVFQKLKSEASNVAMLQGIPFLASKAAKMKSKWMLAKTLLRQLFSELPEHDGEYFPPKTESGNK